MDLREKGEWAAFGGFEIQRETAQRNFVDVFGITTSPRSLEVFELSEAGDAVIPRSIVVPAGSVVAQENKAYALDSWWLSPGDSDLHVRDAIEEALVGAREAGAVGGGRPVFSIIAVTADILDEPRGMDRILDLLRGTSGEAVVRVTAARSTGDGASYNDIIRGFVRNLEQ